MSIDANKTSDSVEISAEIPVQLTWLKVAAIWAGLSIIGYLFGLYTHFQGWMMLMYLIYAPIAIFGIALQTIVLCRYVPQAVQRRGSFQRQFYTLLIVYFIFYFNAFFAPGGGRDINEKWENPIYGESGEIIAIASWIFAILVWVAIVFTASAINSASNDSVSASN